MGSAGGCIVTCLAALASSGVNAKESQKLKKEKKTDGIEKSVIVFVYHCFFLLSLLF